MIFNSITRSRKKTAKTKKMLINVSDPEESRVAIVENHTLINLVVETSKQEKQKGNIYKGIVQKVEPSLRAAFVDFGASRNGFLPLDEVHPDYYSVKTSHKKNSIPADKILKKNQEVLVQVTKQEKETKGAALTTYISLPGRYLVLMPGYNRTGVSRKIQDESERKKLKDLVSQLHIPSGMGFIIRTAGFNKTKKDLRRDLNYLLRLWDAIRKRSEESVSPSLIYQESNIVIQSIRDYFTSDIDEVIVDNREVFKTVKEFFKQVIPKQHRQVIFYEGKEPLFSTFHIEEQIESIYERKVSLKSGGSLCIDPTEALVAIDVNSARFTQLKDPEETALITNLEAADEIARQLCLRNLSGLIVIDFIDMKNQKNRLQVERQLRNAFKMDKANVEFSRISKFGILEMSREEIHTPVADKNFTPCYYCSGRGKVKSTESLSLTILRKMFTLASGRELSMVKVTTSLHVAQYLLNQKRAKLYSMEQKFNLTIHIIGSQEMPSDQYNLEYS